MIKPQHMGLKQAWNLLRETRKGNILSQAMFRSWCDHNAFPYDDEDECQPVQSYEDFTRLHLQIWHSA